MPPRRSAGSAANKQLVRTQNLESEQLAKSRKIIDDAIEATPQLAHDIAFLINNGDLTRGTVGSEPVDPQEKLMNMPPSCNKWFLLKRDRLVYLLHGLRLSNPLANPVVHIPATDLNNITKEDLLRLWCMAIGVEADSFIGAAKLDGALQNGQDRYDTMEYRLQNWSAWGGLQALPNNQGLDWEKCGVFELCGINDKQEFTRVRHRITDVSVLLPMPAKADGTWKIIDNHLETKAMLVSSTFVQINIQQTFEQGKVTLPRILSDSRVSSVRAAKSGKEPFAGHVPSVAGSARGSASAASGRSHQSGRSVSAPPGNGSTPVEAVAPPPSGP